MRVLRNRPLFFTRSKKVIPRMLKTALITAATLLPNALHADEVPSRGLGVVGAPQQKSDFNPILFSLTALYGAALAWAADYARKLESLD